MNLRGGAPYPCNIPCRGGLGQGRWGRGGECFFLSFSLLEDFAKRVDVTHARLAVWQAELTFAGHPALGFCFRLCHQARDSSANLSFPLFLRAPSRFNISSVSSAYSTAPREAGA